MRLKLMKEVLSNYELAEKTYINVNVTFLPLKIH